MSAKVYFLPLSDGAPLEEQARAMARLFDAAGAGRVIAPRDFVAVKIQVGEKNDVTYVKPPLVRAVVDKIKARQALPFLTETSTLYKGERENAVKHLLHAHAHGFSIDAVGAPFIMADGLTGDAEAEVRIDGELHQTVKVAREVLSADALIAIAHPTGHVAAGLGACIKTLGMGLASRMGKMRQHSAMKPEVISKNCRFCQKCLRSCPQEAIIERDGHAYILTEKCIGCGECLAMCRFDAVKYDWGAESGHLQRSMAEHAYGVVKDKRDKCFFFNVMVDMTKDCDCLDRPQKKLIPDLGILASDDPVAIDKAMLDLTAQANANGRDLAHQAYRHLEGQIQIEHGARIGLGSLQYTLIQVQ